MSYNGSGTFQLVAGNPVVTGTVISSTTMNNTLSDIATGLSTAVTKDGQTTPTANIPMGGFKLTGLAAGTALGDAMRINETQTQTYTAFTTGGSATAYTIATSPILAALTTNERYQIKFNAANTSTTPTLARDGLTAKALKVYNSAGAKADPAIGEFAINMLADVVYDGTDYVVLDSLRLRLTSGVAGSVSGTSVDFTGIPSWAKRVTISLNEVSTNGTSNYLFQIGDSGGIETSGYAGTGVTFENTPIISNTNFTTGFGIPYANASNNCNGALILTQIDAATNIWAASGVFSSSFFTTTALTAGSKTLSATLDRVRLTTVGGVNTFDAGIVNILYE